MGTDKQDKNHLDKWYGRIFLAVIPSVAAFLLGRLVPTNYTLYINNDEVTVTRDNVKEIYEENARLIAVNMQLEEDIEELQNGFESTQNELESLMEQAQASQYNLEQERIKQAQINANSENYKAALQLLNTISAENPEKAVLIGEYTTKYEQLIISQADEFLINKQFQNALDLIKDAQSIIPDSNSLKVLYSDIDGRMPIELSTIKISSSRLFSHYDNQSLEDTVGNKYLAGNLFLLKAEGKATYGNGNFYLGDKYNYFSGIIAVSDQSENRSDSDLAGRIEIYINNGEQEILIYESPILTRKSSQIIIEDLNIAGADWLEIRYYNNGEYWNLTQGNHSLEIILAEAVLYN